ncbi:hypothetical protein GCM10010277_17250 [Streptomyces longisporoflavus]|nr:hypothetical protein GCM10010277_17250 [Streptomyces longisporoflavus]
MRRCDGSPANQEISETSAISEINAISAIEANQTRDPRRVVSTSAGFVFSRRDRERDKGYQ